MINPGLRHLAEAVFIYGYSFRIFFENLEKSPLYVTNLWHFCSSALNLLKNTGIIRGIDGRMTVRRKPGTPREKVLIEL